MRCTRDSAITERGGDELTGKRFAFVGCGKQAKKHLHAVTTYVGGSVVAVCDTDPDRAREFAATCDARPFTSLVDMMNTMATDIDIVTIMTPSGVHAANVSELAAYKKPIVIEKPIALRLADADNILHTCEKHGSPVFVVHQNRYNPPTMQAHRALEAGRFGKLVMGTIRLRWRRDQAYYDSAGWRGTWKYDGGVFTNQASHHIDMLIWFMGRPVSVQAVSATRLVDIECEDTGAAIVRFESGAIGVIEATTATRPKDLEGSISILGEAGSVVVGGFFMEKLQTWEFQSAVPEDEHVFDRFGTVPEGWGYNLAEYLKGVVDSVQSGTSGLVSGGEGRRSLELITAIYESIETGREIRLPFQPERCRLGAS